MEHFGFSKVHPALEIFLEIFYKHTIPLQCMHSLNFFSQQSSQMKTSHSVDASVSLLLFFVGFPLAQMSPNSLSRAQTVVLSM